MSVSRAEPVPRRGAIEWLLLPFAEVQRGEGATVLLMMVNAFLLLAAYYIVKPLREALILGGAGAEVKAYSSAVQAALLILLVPAYGRFASHVDRVRLITWVTLFFVSNLVIFYVLGIAGVKALGVPFFLWVGIFNVMIVAQFWAFANDLYTPGQGRRLFAVIAIGSSLGSIGGAWVAKPMIERLGVFTPMLVAAGVLALCMLFTRIISARERVARGVGGRPTDDHAPLEREGGFQLIFRQRYLLLIALLILLLNAVNTTGEYILGKTVAAEAVRVATGSGVAAAGLDAFKEKFIGVFYADFFYWVNLIGALAQMFLVSRILKWFGVRVALFFLPLIALGGYGLLATAPVLAWIRGVKIAENATDYSLNNTVRHALFLPTSREAKYKAKAAIDSVFWRLGDLLSAALVFVGARLALDVRRFALVNMGFVVIWLLLAIGVAAQHRRQPVEEEGERAAAPTPARA